MKDKKIKYFTIIGISIIVVLILSCIGTYNGLVQQREKVYESFSNVQSAYQRRTDLIGNLVETVKGSADFEKETLQSVVEARNKATSVKIDENTSQEQIEKYMEAQNQLNAPLSRLLAVAENYPDLKTTESFRSLMDELSGTENRINVARQDYNTTVRPYNAKIQSFPTNIVAGMFNFQKQAYFEADAGAEKAPKVDFGN